MATMSKLEAFLLKTESQTYSAYYNGRMSYGLYGAEWKKYVDKTFPDLEKLQTSENVFKSTIDLYAENLVPVQPELRGFSNVLVPLLSRGECPVVVDSAGTPHFPEHYEMLSDGRYTVAAIFTRSLEKMEDYVTFVHSDGTSNLWAKEVPQDFGEATREGYRWVESGRGNTLLRFSLDDKGFGGILAAMQDRVNHSILDQTVVEEMYARPFWYLLNTDLPVKNPYLPAGSQPPSELMREQEDVRGSGGRIFTTSSEGPFGQLEPPTIQDMIAYHDSITDKLPQNTGIPPFYFKPGSGVPPTGVALKVLSKRYNNKISRMREDIEPQLEELAQLLGLSKTKEVKPEVATDSEGNELPQDQQPKVTYEYEFWPASDDLLQDALDAHGINLAQMGYPLEYIAEVVTPGVDLDDYMDDSLGMAVPSPDQVAAYAANPGQQAGAPALNQPPVPPQAQQG